MFRNFFFTYSIQLNEYCIRNKMCIYVCKRQVDRVQMEGITRWGLPMPGPMGGDAYYGVVYGVRLSQSNVFSLHKQCC